MKKLFILHLFWWPMLLYAQNNIDGRVVDAATGQGVELATVYINGTTKGAYTNEKGEFLLENVTFPAEMVVSHLSYENATFFLKEAPQTKVLLKVKPQSVALAEVKVEDTNKRKRNVEEFRNAFVGLDEFGKKAKLVNDKVLLFSRDYEKRNIGRSIRIGGGQISSVQDSSASENSVMTIERPLNLKARSIAPVVVDQPELGYKIQVDLVEFQLTYGQGFGNPARTYWLGYYFYEPYKLSKKGKIKRIEKNRLKAYYNSPQHFLRALYQQKLLENGYRFYERIEDPDTKDISYEEFPIYDYLEYRQEESIVQIGGLKDRQFYVFFYPDGQGHPRDLTRKKGRQPVQSLIQFLDDPCLVRSNGTIPNYQILFGGAISEKKIGAMLPEDYEEK